MNILIGIVAGIISGLIASFIFFSVLYLVKPKLKIAEEACIRDIKDNKAVLVIKVVNLSKSFLTNLHYDLYHERREKHSNVRVKMVHPRKNKLWFINKYSKKDVDSSYATLISFDIDLNDINEQNTSYSFVISGEHAISGRRVCIDKSYTEKELVKDGTFHQGKDTKIILND